MARDVQPAAVMISASSFDSVQFLLDQRAHLDGIAPVVAFGGHGFDEDPRRAELVGGVYLGTDLPAALKRLAELLQSVAAEGMRA